MQKRHVAGVIFFLFGLSLADGQDLSVTQNDIRLEYARDAYGKITGYNLFIRHKPGMESVMLTEARGLYALRALEWNPVNGNEARLLYGRRLYDNFSLYSILSSTPVRDALFGAAFMLYLPPYMAFGNSSLYHGRVSLYDGSFTANIRSYSVKYADYTGLYKDNLFLIYGLLHPPVYQSIR